MLILVGVTINLATNGGLFEKSRTASKDTEQKKILEELIAMAEFDNDGKINVDSLIGKVGAKYADSKYEGTKLTVKGNKGEFYYKVTETEIKIWEEEKPGDGGKNEDTFSFKEGKMNKFCLNPDYNSDGTVTKDFWTDLSLESGNKSFDLNDNSGEWAFEGGAYTDDNSNVYLCFSDQNDSYYYSFDKIDMRKEYENNNIIVEGTGWYTKDDDGFHQLTNPENVIFESINVSLSEDYLLQINKHFAQVFKFV